MTKYTPKVGDRVRATLGETAVVGRVSKMRSINDLPHEIDVIPAEDSFATLTLTVHHWQFEQVVEVPAKFGAVVKREDGRVFVRDVRVGDNDRYPWSGRTRVQGYLSDEQVSNGGFTVLFEGVDE